MEGRCAQQRLYPLPCSFSAESSQPPIDCSPTRADSFVTNATIFCKSAGALNRHRDLMDHTLCPFHKLGFSKFNYHGFLYSFATSPNLGSFVSDCEIHGLIRVFRVIQRLICFLSVLL